MKFKPDAFDNIDLGSTQAPRGHYIYSIINFNRNTKIGNKTNDGSQLATLNPILDDGVDPGTGEPPNPVDPISPPPVYCDPKTGICFEVP